MAQPQTTGAQTDPRPRSAAGGDVAVPDRPGLAPGVDLTGEMPDSAYDKAQWLIQRDGRFVQVTELLYRVAEQIDGERTIDEIAGAVSRAIGRNVSADNVRHLLVTKLIPAGLVATADGTALSPATAGGEAGPRSPLQLAMRVRVLDPRFINPFTAVLRHLFWPPVLVAILVVAALAQAWLFGIHGIAGSVHDALYHPALMLALLGLIVVGTVWHEFGHASALRYGGGQVRGMGVGIYLVYPAFYMDVTDNYRLPRWSKVRTDLGGFYFNLIFCAAMVGLYLLTRQSFLLLSVLLIDLEILHQTLPFGRFDGYWALADMTGLPDFFSLIPAFVRSVLPFGKGKGKELDNLKPWVRIAFGLYIVITVPVLCFLLFMMIKNVPRVLATAWDSGHKQLDAIGLAHAHGDTLGIALAAVQLLVLALPTVGLLYILFNLARRLGHALWTWSRPTPGRRVAGGCITIGIVALLGYLWAPQLPFGGGRPGPLYTAASWRPVGADERGTLSDTGRDLAQVPVPFNPFHSLAPSPARGFGTTVRAATSTARPAAGAGKTATPQARPQATSPPGAQPAVAATPTAGAQAPQGATATPAPATTPVQVTVPPAPPTPPPAPATAQPTAPAQVEPTQAPVQSP